MNAIAIITARGGSKRIPKKNIKDFCGKPIIAYSIEAAIQSELFEEVMVSTDSEEIAEIAEKYGAKVPFLRSDKNSNDYATTVDVLKEVVNCYLDRGRAFDYVCCLYPTAPFVTRKKLIDAFGKVISGGADSIYPVVPFSFPPQRGVKEVGGYVKFIEPENYPKRSQDLETIYHDCGQFYIYNTQSLMNKDKLEMKELPYFVSELEVQDIDNETDWKLAEIKYQIMLSGKYTG